MRGHCVPVTLCNHVTWKRLNKIFQVYATTFGTFGVEAMKCKSVW